jgi:hypothetical protein
MTLTRISILAVPIVTVIHGDLPRGPDVFVTMLSLLTVPKA